jgi:5-methylcytosine-specific restriction protein A
VTLHEPFGDGIGELVERAILLLTPRPTARRAHGRERSVHCSMPGCGAVLDEPGRCPEHRTDGWSRFRASEHGRARARGYGARWRRVRDARLTQHPMCEYCGQAKATQVHHVGHELPTDPSFYDIERLRAVCAPCHRKLSQRSGTI